MDLTTREGTDWFRVTRLEAARRMFEAKGELQPVGFLLARVHPETREPMPAPGVGLVIVPCAWDFDGRGKDRFAALLRDASNKLEAAGVAFTTEAWVAVMLPFDGLSPSERPDRQEVVLACFEHIALANPEMWMAPIERVDGKPALGPWVLRASGSKGEGRFIDLMGRMGSN